MIGKTAPEIPGVIAWKNGSPGTLEELRGKVVLLDFWGYWCGPCVSGMPKMFELHDKYRDQGLVIIGIHCDAHTLEQPAVNTPAEMDALVAEYRQDLWGGRDIPFSVALVPAETLKHRGGSVENRALNQASAAYGISGYPSYVLIDRQGKVAGHCKGPSFSKSCWRRSSEQLGDFALVPAAYRVDGLDHVVATLLAVQLIHERKHAREHNRDKDVVGAGERGVSCRALRSNTAWQP